jgi:DNA-directed RNA polymerase beta subunit
MSSDNTNQRINFASTKNPLAYPDFLEIQLKSFQDFLQLDTPPEKRKKEGLYKVFAENFLLPTQETILFLSSWIIILTRRVIYRRLFGAWSDL